MSQIINYPRAPSNGLRELLEPGGFLAPVIALHGRRFNGLELDVHFRIKDEIQVYCGLTRILTVRRLQRPSGRLIIDADGKYTGQTRAKETGLFRRWVEGEKGLSDAIEAYLASVEVNTSFTIGEGAVQSRWSRVTEPWIPFDREGVLNYESTEHRQRAKKYPGVDAAFESIQAVARDCGWKELKPGARKVDQLAIDPLGRLVLIELKDAKANDHRVYYVPFQLLQYLWEWHGALEAVQSDLQELLDARSIFGLMVTEVAPLKGGTRAAVGFGPDNRTVEVKRRYDIVLEIANNHLPPGVAPIETWEHTDSGPRSIAQMRTTRK